MEEDGCMAGGSRSVVGGSDHDIPCDPCKDDGRHSEGMSFCTICKEYLCTDCLKDHKEGRSTKGHNTLEGSALPRPDNGLLCDDHQQHATMFCVKHNVSVCDMCPRSDHRECKESLKEISQISQTEGTQEKREAFQAQLECLIDRLKDLQTFQHTCEEKLRQDKKECHHFIETFRHEINDVLDNLQEEINREVGCTIDKELKRVSKRLTTMADELEVVQNASVSLSKVNDERSGFVTLAKLRPGVEKRKRFLTNEEIEKQSVRVVFNPHPMLTSLLADCKRFGEVRLHRSYDCTSTILPGYLRNAKVGNSLKHNIKEPTDRDCYITGITILNNDFTLMCDKKNKKIKLMDRSGKIVSSLRMQTGPRDVVCIGDGKAAVTLPEQKTIGIVKIEGTKLTLQERRSIKTTMLCWGLAYNKGNLYVSCHDDPGNAEVICVMMKEGQQQHLVVWRDTEPVKTAKILRPSYIALGLEGQIHLSDSGTGKLIRLTTSGEGVTVPNINERTGVKGSTGLLVDSDRNVYIVGYSSHNLQIVDASGDLLRTLVKKGDGLIRPLCLAYRKCDKTLLVGMDGNDIQSYTLVKALT